MHTSLKRCPWYNTPVSKHSFKSSPSAVIIDWKCESSLCHIAGAAPHMKCVPKVWPKRLTCMPFLLFSGLLEKLSLRFALPVPLPMAELQLNTINSDFLYPRPPSACAKTGMHIPLSTLLSSRKKLKSGCTTSYRCQNSSSMSRPPVLICLPPRSRLSLPSLAMYCKKINGFSRGKPSKSPERGVSSMGKLKPFWTKIGCSLSSASLVLSLLKPLTTGHETTALLLPAASSKVFLAKLTTRAQGTSAGIGRWRSKKLASCQVRKSCWHKRQVWSVGSFFCLAGIKSNYSADLKTT